MSKLKLDLSLIAQSRSFASQIASNTQAFIDLHTTPSVERAIVRLLGIDGVDSFDVPIPNRIVDEVFLQGKLGYGVSNILASAMKRRNQSLAQIV
ncbi:MAG: lysine 5,6-aminomutase subunit alpha, partial [bacterium]|nr:lysine 5,6-aminomutase subunit alpha [bacterium]